MNNLKEKMEQFICNECQVITWQNCEGCKCYINGFGPLMTLEQVENFWDYRLDYPRSF